MRLVCLPYAGGGTALYQPWWKELPAWMALWAARLPGRESRIGEPPLRDAHAVVEPLAAALAAAPPAPALALYGHSMGGLLAFELAHALEARGIRVAALVVSGCRAPHLAPSEDPLHELDDETFVQQLAGRYDGMPQEILEHRELMELLLPMLRADLAIVERYRLSEREPGTWPLFVYGGTDDRTVEPGALEAWRRHTRSAFRLEMFAGGHFFINENRGAVLRSLGRDLAPFVD